MQHAPRNNKNLSVVVRGLQLQTTMGPCIIRHFINFAHYISPPSPPLDECIAAAHHMQRVRIDR